MTYANRTKAAENLPALPNVAFHSSSHVSFGLKQIFVGSNGLRAGWRLLMFLDLFGVLWGGIALIRAGGPQAIPEQYKNQSHITITPLLMGGSEAITFRPYTRYLLRIAQQMDLSARNRHAAIQSSVSARPFPPHAAPPRMLRAKTQLRRSKRYPCTAI
jgi:hypothetical protein